MYGVVNGQWSVFSGQWSMYGVVNGQWAVVSGQWSMYGVVNVWCGQCLVVNGQCEIVLGG